MTAPVIIESAEFQAEQDRLTVDNVIIDMAGGLYFDPNAPKGQALLDWLDSWEGIQAARVVADKRGVRFQSIGGPARAIRHLVAITIAEESK